MIGVAWLVMFYRANSWGKGRCSLCNNPPSSRCRAAYIRGWVRWGVQRWGMHG